MKRFVNFLEKNKHSFFNDGEGYCIQVYSDGKKGNIKKGEFVLVRFNLDEKRIYFNFSKDNNPYEFSYDGYDMLLDRNVDEIKNLNHKDAETLCEVIKRFIADNN